MDTIHNTDVVVLGGGAAGVAAAVAAARQELRVVLIERNAYPGGKATAAAVGTVCGLYQFSKNEKPAYIVKGFAKEFAESLQKASDSKPLHNTDGLHYLPYNITAFKDLCLELLTDNKVDAFFNTTLTGIKINNERINSAILTNKDKFFEMGIKAIVDCSGDSIISQAANIPSIKSEQYQAAAQVFSMKGIAENNEARLGLILIKALRSAIDDKMLADHFDRVYIVQGSLKNNTVSLKIGIPIPVTHTPENPGELKKAAHHFIEILADFLIKNVTAFKNASIHEIAPEPGIRVGLRNMGNYILTEEDVLGCRKFDDAIANASWPIEEWDLHRRVKMRYFKLDDYYQVPAGCLQSKFIKNLYMAGRNISATNAAIASARVMGTCLQTGFAAGMLAAALVKGLPESEAIKSILNTQL